MEIRSVTIKSIILQGITSQLILLLSKIFIKIMQLYTERLVLRDITIDDKQNIFDYRSDAEANKFQGWIPETLEEVESFIQRNTKEFNQPESWYQLLITDKETKAVIGDIGVHFIGDENVQVELGITLNISFQVKGYNITRLSQKSDKWPFVID